MKKCKKCGIEKDTKDFYKNKKMADGLYANCKVCHCKESNNPEGTKKYRQSEHGKEYRYRYMKTEKMKEYRRLYMKEYYKTDKYKEYIKDKMKNDINFRISNLLRKRIGNVLKRNQKAGSTIKDLGCLVSELKIYLENKFYDGMNWENQGKWHIDHKKPLSKFDLTDRKQFLQACHFTNLQPLWAKDNLMKGNRL